MPHITVPDGTRIYYTEQGSGRPVILSHGWPLSSDAWQLELKLLADAGYRAIAHDRRGHGRSSHTYTGNDMDTYAADLAVLVDQLDLTDITVVGHSTGGGEVVRYAARYGNARVRKVVTVGAVTPIMLRSPSNPHGTSIEDLDAIRSGVLDDRSEFYRDLSVAFYGANRAGSTVSQGLRDDFWRQGMLVGLAAAHDCVEAFSETDFTADLRALTVPILIAHGDDDQIVPIDATARKAIELVDNGTLEVYPGASHGIHGAYQKALDHDILAFIGD
ncbi:alpha/beta fold hydrolase [Nocardia sp. NPDC052278]|uniref:alpha/beta fold hydrolase n=1 Tax=unclassified Nocardia TaxID=2637762 RepID=UPI0036AB20CB